MSGTNTALFTHWGLLAASFVLGSAAIDEASFLPKDVISKDVVIIGGGASGAYAAVRLREDFGKSIVVMEKENHLGGHVATFTDTAVTPPVAYDYGVQSYLNYGNASAFFAHLNVPTTSTYTRVNRTNHYLDFTTGTPIAYTPPAPPAASAASAAFAALCRAYEPLMLPGYHAFPRGDAIPSDLLLPFSAFVAKYGLEAAVPAVFATTGLGIGNMIAATAFAVLQGYGVPVASAGVPAMFVPVSRNNSELYGRIGELLGGDVLYGSVVVETERGGEGQGDEVNAVVRRADGGRVLVKAKRLLLAIEPTLRNMAAFDVDEREREVFSKWEYSTIYAGVVSHPGLPLNASLVNTPPGAAPANHTAFPQTPFVARFDYLGGGAGRPMFRVLVVGDEGLSSAAAKGMVEEAFEKIAKAGSVGVAAGLQSDSSGESAKLEWMAWADHGPMQIRVSAEELQKGFMTDLYKLQGRRGVWFTGAAWSVFFTTHVWAFTETVLPGLVQGL